MCDSPSGCNTNNIGIGAYRLVIMVHHAAIAAFPCFDIAKGMEYEKM